MKENNFCVFILSNGRPDKVITYNTIRKAGYTGKIFIIIDNEDVNYNKYIKNFGDENVIVFNKMEYALNVDNYDNFGNYRSTTHVRNAIFDEAKRLGYKYNLVS